MIIIKNCNAHAANHANIIQLMPIYLVHLPFYIFLYLSHVQTVISFEQARVMQLFVRRLDFRRILWSHSRVMRRLTATP